jgi:hypothetical protein
MAQSARGGDDAVTPILYPYQRRGIRVVAGALDGTPQALVELIQALTGASAPKPDETGYFARDEA